MKVISTLGLDVQYRQQLALNCPNYQVEHIQKLSDLDDHTLKNVEILLTYGDHMPDCLVEKMDALRWIHSGQAGIDAMPKKLLMDKDIFVTNSRGINSITIAEYVMCMLLNLERNTYRFYDAYLKREWDMQTHLDEVAEKTIGILGMGKVGTEIAKRAKAFDMRVLGLDLRKVTSAYLDESYTLDEFNTFLKKCDYVVICMPLTEKSRHMFGKETLSLMKPEAVLVNVGRGPIVDTDALVDALETKKIRAAILDVLEQEPVVSDSPLWDVNNLIITPHIAGDRQAAYMPRMMRILCDNLNRYPDFDHMINPVDLGLGF